MNSNNTRRRASISGPGDEHIDRTRRLEVRQMRIDLENAERARLCADCELRLVKARLREVEYELAARRENTVDIGVQTEEERPLNFGRRLGGRDNPVALALEGDIGLMGQISATPTVYVSPKGSKSVSCSSDDLDNFDDTLLEEESIRTTVGSEEVTERDTAIEDLLKDTEGLSLSENEVAQEEEVLSDQNVVDTSLMDTYNCLEEIRPEGLLSQYAENTGCGVAMAMVARGAELLRSSPSLSHWVRSAVATEAEHISRRKDDPQGKRVRFAHFDLSAVPPPIDTVRDSEIEARAVAKRLADVVQTGEVLADADRNALEAWTFGLRTVSENYHYNSLSKAETILPDQAQVRGAASFWVAEAESLLTGNKNISPVRSRLSNLLSSLLRHDLRRLFNPPPPPGTKPAFLNNELRSPLGDRSLNNDFDDSGEESRPNTRGSRQKKKSRRASIISSVYNTDDESHPFAWCRSAAHKLVAMECLDDDNAAHGIPEGSIASQITTALLHLSKTPPPLVEPRQNTIIPKTIQDVEAGWHRLDAAAARINAACGVRFLHKLLHFPKLDSVLSEVGGWHLVENYAQMATQYGQPSLAAQFAPLCDVKLFKSYLKEGLDLADKDRRDAQAEVAAIVRAFAHKRRLAGSKELAHAASAVARSALLYPDLKPAVA